MSHRLADHVHRQADRQVACQGCRQRDLARLEGRQPDDLAGTRGYLDDERIAARDRDAGVADRDLQRRPYLDCDHFRVTPFEVLDIYEKKSMLSGL